VPTTAEELCEIGDDGVLALVCDSTNVFNPKARAPRARSIAGCWRKSPSTRRRIVVTTFASNVARLADAGRGGARDGRELCVAGRSLDG
jgi:ribonuclease J